VIVTMHSRRGYILTVSDDREGAGFTVDLPDIPPITFSHGQFPVPLDSLTSGD
jgi:hypothetical protein